MTLFRRKRVLRNKLLELMQERERKIGRRLKQHDIAQFAGVSDHTIINWIRNDVTKFDGQTIERLCDYFNCDVGDLLYFEWVDAEDTLSVDE